MNITAYEFNKIKEHYKKIEPYFYNGFGYLCGHTGWYKWENNIPSLSTYEHFMKKLNIRNFTLFQTINQYDISSDIWFEIPVVPTNNPKKPFKAYQTELAINDVKGYMVTIDLDMDKDENGQKLQMIEHQDVANDVVSFLRDWFKDINCVVFTSGNGLYVYFPVSSMLVGDTFGDKTISDNEKYVLIDAWSLYMEKLRKHLYAVVPEAKGKFIVDNIFTANRQIKAPGSIHKKNRYVVLPVQDKIPFKKVDELTPEDYIRLENIIKTLQNPFINENNELKDILETEGFIDIARENRQKNEEYTPGTFGSFENEVSFDIINKCPLLFRLFSPDFNETRTTHRAVIMARYLINLGYTDERIKGILKGYKQFEDSMIDDAIRFNYHGRTQEVMPAPNYTTVTSVSKGLPGLGAKEDYGDIRAPEGYKNPIQFIKDIIKEEQNLMKHVEDIVPIDNTSIVRERIRNVSNRIVKSENKSLNVAPPRAGKTHSTIAELLENSDYGSLIFGESHEQLNEMGSKFPALFHWKGKQLLCPKSDEYKRYFDFGLNPCKNCGVGLSGCEWKQQLQQSVNEPHILINKANIWNGVAENLIKQQLDTHEGTRKHVIFDENIHEIEATYYKPLKHDDIVFFAKCCQNLTEYIPVTIAHINDDLRGIDKNTLKTMMLELNTDDEGLIDILLQEADDKAFELEVIFNQFVENLGVLIINKENGITTEGETQIFVERSPVDTISPTILLDATPSPNMDLTDFNTYDIEIPEINTMIIRPQRGDQTLTYAKDTAKHHHRKNENTYIKWIKDQIRYIEAAGLTVGLISYKEVNYGGEKPMELEELFPEIDTLYYGGVRGRSDLDNKDVLIVLGTWKPLTEAVYPEYRYRGGTKSYNEINKLYQKNEYQRTKDGVKRRITGDQLFDDISLHVTTSEMEQAILRNMGHLKTRLLICVSAVPETLDYLEQVQFNWNARDQINWSSIYEKYASTLYGRVQKREVLTKQLDVSVEMNTGKNHAARDTRRALKKLNKTELLEQIWNQKESGEKWVDIYESLDEPPWKNYKSMKSAVTRWAKKYY